MLPGHLGPQEKLNAGTMPCTCCPYELCVSHAERRQKCVIEVLGHEIEAEPSVADEAARLALGCLYWSNKGLAAESDD